MRLVAGGRLPRLQVHKPVGLLAQPITTISVTMTKVTDTDANAFYCPAQMGLGVGMDLDWGAVAGQDGPGTPHQAMQHVASAAKQMSCLAK